MKQSSLGRTFQRATRAANQSAKTANTVMSFPYWDEIRVRMLEDVDGSLVIHEAPYRSRALNRKAFLTTYRRFAKHPFKPFPLLDDACPFCSTFLIKVDYNDLADEDDFWEKEELNKGALEHCPNCVYWRWHFAKATLVGRSGAHNLHEYTSSLSKIGVFDESLPPGCLTEISQHIRRDANWWHSVSPTKLEELVADIFKANYTGAEVVHVGKPDDGGVDVLFIDCEHEKWLIQVKRRESPRATETVETIRNLLGAMILEGTTSGIVVSTADHFSYRACQTTDRAAKLGYIIKLYDRGLLNKLLDHSLPDRPWFDLVKAQLPEMLPSLVSTIPSSLQLNLFRHL